MKFILAAGARPNFMKIAPLLNAIAMHNKDQKNNKRIIEYIFVHTGQHYDNEMSNSFFLDLNLPAFDIHLGVGSGTHAEQTGKIMIEFEKVCFREKPDLVIVVGDVNSTIACALVSAKLCIPVAHIEAGLRSYDKSMPEEVNRILTDQISDYLFTTCKKAGENLIREGISESKIFFVGNVMIDTLLKNMNLAQKSKILDTLGLKNNDRVKKYGVITLHRPSNVDNRLVLEGILEALGKIARFIPIIFPIHPRTLTKIRDFKLESLINYSGSYSSHKSRSTENEVLGTPPLSYLDFLCLMSHSAVTLTDSGGIQEETTILGIPCLTLRNNTERPITVSEGTNIVVGNNPKKIEDTALSILKNKPVRKKSPKYWDGKAAERIVKILTKHL